MGKPVKHAALNSMWSLIFAVLLSVALVACGGHGGGGGDGLNSNNNGNNNNSGASTLSSVVGDGINYPADYSASMDVNVNTVAKTGSLNYFFDAIRFNFMSTSITDVVVAGNVVTITGTGTVTRNGTDVTAGCTFTATITDGSPDEMGIEIHNPDSSLNYQATSQPLTTGNYNLIGDEIIGDGLNNPPDYSASMDVNINAVAKTGTLDYIFDAIRFDFMSTSITDVTAAGNAVTITGTGTVTRNGTDVTAGCTFTATITDGSPDEMGIEIHNPDSSLNYQATSQPLTTGNYTID